MVKITAVAKWVGNVRTFVDNSRTHTVVCDLPTGKGGDDTGPTALELAVMALADCVITIYADVAKKSKIELTKLEAVAEAEKPEDSHILSNVSLKVNVAGKARKQLLEACMRRTEAMCPVVAIFQKQIPTTIQLETVSE